MPEAVVRTEPSAHERSLIYPSTSLPMVTPAIMADAARALCSMLWPASVTYFGMNKFRVDAAIMRNANNIMA